MIKLATCKTCKQDKDLSAFAKGTRRLHCRQCVADRDRERYRDPAYRQVKLSINAKYRSANRTELNAKLRQYYEEHPGLNSANCKRFRENNPEYVKAASQQSKALRRGAPDAELIERNVVWERDQGICGICALPVDQNYWELDHIVPVSKGGKHHYGNVQVSHPLCNRRKGAKI